MILMYASVRDCIITTTTIMIMIMITIMTVYPPIFY